MTHLNHPSMKNQFSGMLQPCPTLNASKPYVYLDNGASTPALKCVVDAVEAYMPYYSSVHRGTGFKSLLSTHLFEQCREKVLQFVSANSSEHCCIFTRNTTESINKLARRFPFTRDRFIVLTTTMEHHADDLPWRAYAPKTVHVDVLADGQLDFNDFKSKLEEFKGQIALVAVTGASNVTGYINPIHEIARLTHEAGGQIFVDCAQLIAHRKVDMKRLDDPEHIDYIAFSGHKMYAPYGTGTLVGRLDTFNHGEPDLRGGGAVSLVTLDRVIWAPAPDRDEAGSPNIPGSVALLAAIIKLESIGMDYIAKHEADLTRYALLKLKTVPGIRIFGDQDPENASNRVGVIPFSLERISPDLVAAIMGHEFGIGVRSGCFCAHPLIGKLLGVSEYLLNEYSCIIENGETSLLDKPGLIRISFGMYNDESDIDQAVDSLIRITKGDYKGRYVANKGDYFPVDWSPDYFDKYVDIARIVEGSCKDEEFKLHSKQKSKEKIYIKETVHAVSCNSSTETISVKYESNQYLSSLLGYF